MSEHIPTSLRLLLRTLKFTKANALDNALPFARAMLSDMKNLDDPDAQVTEFLNAYHDDDRLYARVVKYLDSDEFAEAAHPISNGDVTVAYTEPAIVLGIALACVLMTDRESVGAR